jgi:choloylglycine hydrolase
MNPRASRWAPHALTLLAGVCAALSASKSARACSLALWADNGRSVVVGRNVDWIEDPKTDLWAMPRGVKRQGTVSGKPLEWTSKYASIVGVAYDSMVNTGMNEKGLAANCLWLATGDHGPRDAEVPGISESEWPQFYLDSFATVAEAVEYTKTHKFQVRGTKLGPFVSMQHLTIQDASGDSAVFEYEKGELKIYHDRKYRVVTNEPTYDLQIQNLKQYTGFGGDKALPGTTEAADRFVRGAYYLTHLPKPKTDRETIAGMISVMRSMAQPMGTPDPSRPNISMTVCTVVFDLTRHAIYYEASTSPYPIWVWLDRLDLAEGRQPRRLADINKVDRIGDVTDQMTEATAFTFSPGE